MLSLPSRERGLKYIQDSSLHIATDVAPLAGAWIEIQRVKTYIGRFSVAPLAGAWIEISANDPLNQLKERRSPRGSVD